MTDMIARGFAWRRRGAVLLALASAAVLAGCQTANRVNPFGREDQSEITEDDRRVAILALDEQLNAADELGGATITLPASASNADYVGEGGPPSHALGHPSLGAAPSVVWRRDVGEGSSRDGRVSAPPVIGDGRIFAMDGAGRVSAFQVTGGERDWTKTLKSGARRDRQGRGGGVAYGAGRVFVASGYGFIAALDAATGDEIWRRETSGPMHSAPTAADGRVFAISFDSELFALDAATGEVLWTYQSLSEPARILTSSSPAVVGDTVIAPFASGELAALRVENGRQVWTETLTRSSALTALAELNDIAGSPVVADGFVYGVSHSGISGAFDLRTGQRVWNAAAGGIHMPWVAGDAIFIATSDSQIAALSRVDGRAYWVRQLDRYENTKKRKGRVTWAGPILAGGQLYVASSKGRLLALDPGNGETVNEIKIGDPVYVSPIVANDTLFLVSDDARLIALR